MLDEKSLMRNNTELILIESYLFWLKSSISFHSGIMYTVYTKL